MAELAQKEVLHTVIFDAGGTLVQAPDLLDRLWPAMKADTKNIERAVFWEKFSFFKESTEKNFVEVKELLKSTVKSLSQEYGFVDISPSVAEAYSDLYKNYTTLCEGVQETLEWLRAHDVRLILLSDADADVLRDEFDTVGITHFFDEMVISSEIESYKPSDKTADFMQKFLAEPKSGILMVGDTSDDVDIAKKMGVKVLQVKGRREPCVAAHFVVSAFSEVRDLIEAQYSFRA